MEEMREIVDISQVDAAIKIGAVAFPLVCLAVAGVVGWRNRAWRSALIRGAFVAALGPLVLVAWLYYSWMVRYDPETGYFGLDKVWVLVVNFVVFVAAGGAYGYAAGRLWARPAKAKPDVSANGKT